MVEISRLTGLWFFTVDSHLLAQHHGQVSEIAPSASLQGTQGGRQVDLFMRPSRSMHRYRHIKGTGDWLSHRCLQVAAYYRESNRETQTKTRAKDARKCPIGVHWSSLMPHSEAKHHRRFRCHSEGPIGRQRCHLVRHYGTHQIIRFTRTSLPAPARSAPQQFPGRLDPARHYPPSGFFAKGLPKNYRNLALSSIMPPPINPWAV